MGLHRNKQMPKVRPGPRAAVRPALIYTLLFVDVPGDAKGAAIQDKAPNKALRDVSGYSGVTRRLGTYTPGLYPRGQNHASG